MEIDFWKSVRDWQTAIASFVGFSGVITTLFVNAHLVRRNEYRQRLRELKSLRTALREEMIFTRDGLISALSTPAPENSNPSYDEMIINGSGDCGIYKANLGKIGQLESEELAAILHAYFAVQNMDMLLQTKNKSKRPDVLVLSASHRPLVDSIYRSVITPLNKAIIVLGGECRTIP